MGLRKRESPSLYVFRPRVLRGGSKSNALLAAQHTMRNPETDTDDCTHCVSVGRDRSLAHRARSQLSDCLGAFLSKIRVPQLSSGCFSIPVLTAGSESFRDLGELVHCER